MSVEEKNNYIEKIISELAKSINKQFNKKVLTKTNSNNKSSGFANVLTLTLLTGFVAGILSMIVYLMIK